MASERTVVEIRVTTVVADTERITEVRVEAVGAAATVVQAAVDALRATEEEESR